MSARQHWADMGENTFTLGILILFWIHRLLGRWPFLLCLYPIVCCYWLAQPRVRQASGQYLQRLESATGALGHQPGRLDTLRHLLLFAETLLDKLLAVSGRYQFKHIRVEGRELLLADATAGQGGIIVTAHIGCLELCRALAEQRRQVRLNVLVHTRHAVRFNRLLKRLNPDNDVQLIEVTDIGPETALMLDARVRAGEFIVIAGDRVPVSAGRTVQADFLGHAAHFPIGPYTLASLLKCPLYLLGCLHEANHYAIYFRRLSDQVLLPRGQREAALARYAARYADALTDLLRRSPYDWFNFFSFWNQGHDINPPHS